MIASDVALDEGVVVHAVGVDRKDGVGKERLQKSDDLFFAQTTLVAQR